MEKLKNFFKKESKSSEEIKKTRENVKSMLGLSEAELAKLSEEELAELSGGEEVSEFPDEEEGRESYVEEKVENGKKNFNTSLLNQIISDSVLRYALEKGYLEFLRKVKSGKITDEEYETMKKEMKEWWENIRFEWSLLQEISKDYVYYLALEKVDEKMLRWLLNHTLTFNYKYHDFAERNWWDMIMWWWIAEKQYHDWISTKLK